MVQHELEPRAALTRRRVLLYLVRAYDSFSLELVDKVVVEVELLYLAEDGTVDLLNVCWVDRWLGTLGELLFSG